LCTLAGGCDHTNLENPSSEYVEALQRAQEPDAHFQMNWGPEDLGFNLQLNQSETLGITNDRDMAVRQLFRDGRFRQAVSHALDREGIAQSIMRGPFIRAFTGGLYPGSPEYDVQSAVYYPYNVDRANELLAEIGLEDTDGNGILNFTEGPIAGEDVVLGLNTSQDAQESQIVGDQIVAMLGAVGIKVNPRPVTSQTEIDTSTSGQWDMNIDRSDSYKLPFTYCSELAPLTDTTPNWNRQGEGERVLRDFEQELVDLATAYCAEQDPEARKQLINQWNYVWTSNNYLIGTIIGRKGLALAKRFQNVPAGTPPHMYTWVEDAIISEMIWTPEDQHNDQLRPNTVPVYPAAE
jgi:peptide/nickel transport system substrate-binding protein